MRLLHVRIPGIPASEIPQHTIMTRYDQTFFDYVNAGALRSAKRLLPVVIDILPVRSVLDVGCGQGAWLSVWSELGAEIAIGLDGDYVDRERLLIPKGSFCSRDLTQRFELGRRFDLVQSLEVAEHLPAAAAGTFVASLVAHADMVLFSAAPKGQGGDHHINEQSYDYWRELFARHGYIPVDAIRRRVLDDAEIEPWYRYNTILYVAGGGLEHLPEDVTAERVPDHLRIPDLSPVWYRIRKALVALLPVPVASSLAKLKERRLVRSLRASSSAVDQPS